MDDFVAGVEAQADDRYPDGRVDDALRQARLRDGHQLPDLGRIHLEQKITSF